MADVKLQAVLTLKDKMTANLKKSQKGVESFASQAKKATVIVGALGLAMGANAVKQAIKFESAFAGVRKTVDATEAEFKTMQKQFLNMSKEFPTAASELARIGELAGQLGVAKENIINFAKTISDLAVTTNLTSEEAATSFARIINIMGISQDSVDNMGSAVVDLGNNFATTEADIVMFATRIAGAGKIAGLTTSDIFGIGAAMSSVGIEAEAGGTAVQKVLLSLNEAVLTNNKDMKIFADTAGVSAEEFGTAWETDAGMAFNDFVVGLGKQGDDAIFTLQELGLQDQRLIRSFLSLAGAGDVITDSINTSNVAWEDNSALMIEADKRYGTTASQIDVLKNNFSAVSIELGDIFLPAINDVLAVMRGDLGRTWIDDAGDQIQLFIDAIGEALRKFGNLLLLVSTGGVFGEGGAVDKIKGFFGGGRASGGPVSGGTPYVVGEKGPELFVPQGSGSIVPNDQMGGGATTINFNNATVRNDSDLDSIISAVKQSLNRDLSIEQLGI